MARKAIVVGVDGSEESRHALGLAAQVAAAARAKLVPVYAVPDLWLAGGLQDVPAVLPEIYDVLVRDARDWIKQFVAEVLGPEARKTQLEIRTGAGALAIADVARERRAELVVLGGKHHAALARGLGRSTVHYLVRTLDVPLLVVGPSPSPLRHILAAVDLSAAAPPALRAAERLAALLGARLRVVHVVEPLRLMYLPASPLDQEGFEQRSRDAFAHLMKRFAQIAPEDRVTRTGLAAETLAEEAVTWPAHLIVVGSHGKGWVDRMLVGSTTEQLLNTLPASVLVIPTAGTPKRQRAARHVARPKPKRRPRAKPRTKTARRR